MYFSYILYRNVHSGSQWFGTGGIAYNLFVYALPALKAQITPTLCYHKTTYHQPQASETDSKVL